MSSSTNHDSLATAPIWRSLAHLCIPMVAGVSIGVVYNLINAGFIGSLHSTALLAALTYSLPVFALIMALGGVLGVGGGTYISRLLGSEETGEGAEAAALRVRRVSSVTWWGSIGLGAVVGVFGLVFATPLASAIGATGDATPPTAQYIGAMFAFAPFLVASFALEQLVRAEGAAVASMAGLIASTIANLIFDAIFILGFGWGVLGAGIALGLSNVVMVAWYLWWICRRSETMSLSLRHLRLDGEMVRSILGVGASEFLMSSFLIVSTLVLNWVAGSYGEALMASMGVALRVSQLPEMICMGIALGAIPLFAYAHGAKNHARLRRAVSGALLAILGVTGVFTTAVFLFRGPILALFSADPTVLTDGMLVLTAMLISTIFNGTTALIIAVFQATGQIRGATIMAVAQGLIFVPVVLGARALAGMTGVIWATTVAEVLTFALGVALLAGSWRALMGSTVGESRGVLEPAPSMG